MQHQLGSRGGGTRIGGGWMRLPVLVIAVIVMTVGAAAGYLRWSTTPDNGASPVLGTVIPTVLFLVVVIVATFFSFVRTVEIHEDEAIFLSRGLAVVAAAGLATGIFAIFFGVAEWNMVWQCYQSGT